MNSKHILVVSNSFYPEISPRAFRTTELVKEFARRGHWVTLVLPDRTIFREQPLPLDGVTVLSGEGISNTASETRSGKSLLAKILPDWAKRAVLYFYNHELYVKYDKGIARRLRHLQGPFDAVISISYPAAIHRAVSKAFRKNPTAFDQTVKIAEFSDPPFRGDVVRRVFPGYNAYLKRWGREFNYFVTPVTEGISVYTPYITSDRIKVIPQGFDFSATRLADYKAHEIPTFAYAGRFYEHIRDPRYFFDFLKTIDRNFRFDLYLNHVTPYFSEMIETANRETRGEIVLHTALPREELITELSRYDFLVNFENTTANASPSKLIDYALTGRPILSLRKDNFDPQTLLQFMDGNYEHQVRGIDLEQYDIRNVADRFLELIQR